MDINGTAFGVLAAKTEDKKESAYVINPTATIESDFVVVRFPLSEVGKAKPSKTKTVKDPITGVETTSGGSLGFMSGKAIFQLGEQKFSLNPGWIGLKAEK